MIYTVLATYESPSSGVLKTVKFHLETFNHPKLIYIWDDDFLDMLDARQFKNFITFYIQQEQWVKDRPVLWFDYEDGI